jgi:hypothetical protein
MQGFKSNKDEATQIMEEIHQVLCCILSLHSATQRDGILPPAILYDIAKFTEYDLYLKLSLNLTLVQHNSKNRRSFESSTEHGTAQATSKAARKYFTTSSVQERTTELGGIVQSG